ncbi:MAG: ComEC/Rec2 family competence protein [Clostridia bacterium]|nr:ComEC/Rec2 family competence protein [Clostridia bacterium]
MFVKRPVAVFGMCFFAAFCLLTNLRADTSFLPAVVSCAVLLIASLGALFFKRTSRERQKIISLYAVIAAAGVLAASVFALTVFKSERTRYEYLDGKDVTLHGTVNEEFWVSGNKRCFKMKVDSVNGERASFCAAFITPSELEVGDIVTAEAGISTVEHYSDLDRERYYLSEGVTLIADASYVSVTGRSSSPIVLAKRLNVYLCGILTEKMSEKSGGIAAAILLGDRSGVGTDTKRDFSRIGISHLLAISGMHVAFFCLAASFLFRALRVGKRRIAALNIGLMVFYMFLTGFSPSVVRAASVCCLASLVVIFGVSYDAVTALAVCGAVILLVDPFLSFSVAMQMSYTACLGCFAGAATLRKTGIPEKVKGKNPFVRLAGGSLSAVIITGVIVLFTLPILLIYYDEISFISPLSNLIFIPAVSVMLYLSLIVIVLSPIPPLYAAASFVADRFIRAALNVAHAVSGIRNITVSLNYSFAPYFIAAICLCVILIALGRKRVTVVSSAALALCLASFAVCVAADRAEHNKCFTVARAGSSSGDAVILASGGRTMLCDVSLGDSRVLSRGIGEIKRLCITELDSYLMTNYTPSNLQSLETVVDSFYLGSVYLLPPGDGEEENYKEALSYLQRKGVEAVAIPTLPDKAEFEDVTLSFCAKTYKTSSGAPVICFGAMCGDASVIYLGSDWASCRPNAPRAIGASDVVIFGSFGPRVSKDYPQFGDCKIYSFASGTGVEVRRPEAVFDANSSFALKLRRLSD